MSFLAGGEQYIGLVVGWGGIYPLMTGELSRLGGEVANISRVLAFKLNGQAVLPPAAAPKLPQLSPPEDMALEETVTRGKVLYHRYCMACHGDSAVGGGVVSDLRYSTSLSNDALFANIVLNGALKSVGMASFADNLSPHDLSALQAYLVHRAHQKLDQDKLEKESPKKIGSE